jgi:uncharacterized DUF497 family protein
MDFEWDSAKASANAAKHGVQFEDVRRFQWQTAFTAQDNRQTYGEVRWVSVGLIEDRLHKITYMFRDNRVRVISAHKANRRDQRKYHDARANRRLSGMD